MDEVSDGDNPPTRCFPAQRQAWEANTRVWLTCPHRAQRTAVVRASPSRPSRPGRDPRTPPPPATAPTHLFFYEGPPLGAPAVVRVMRYGRGTAKVTQLDGPLVTEQQVFHLQNSKDSPYELGVQRPRPRECCRDRTGFPRAQ